MKIHDFVDETSLATMRAYYAGDKDASDKLEITKQREYFASQEQEEVANKIRLTLGIKGGNPAEVMQRAIDLLVDRPETATSRSIKAQLLSIIDRLKISVGKHHYQKLNRAVESAEQSKPSLNEVDMSPSALAQFAKGADQFGIRAGFEAEMLFTGISPRGEGGESEPDYEGADERISSNASLDDLQEFFSETMSRNNRVWARMEEEYLDAVYEKAQEFVDENIDERVRERVLDEVSEDDRLYNYLSSNGHSDEDIDKIIAAGNDAPAFTRSADERAYAEENPLYKFWSEAQSAVEEEIESEIDRMRDEVEEELRDEFMSDNDYYMGEWLRDNNIDYMSELSREYELDWPHWTENTEYEAFDDYEMRRAVDDLEEALGMGVEVSDGYHNAERTDDKYIVEPDGSLEPDDPSEHGSAEIISPPMPLDQMIDHLKKVIAWAKSHGGYTNHTTGLHVGVSLPDMSKVDYIKLALLVGDQHVLKVFGREFNTYCRGVFKQIAANRNEQTIAQSVDALKSGMIGVASTALKYTVFNASGTTEKKVTLNWKNRYIEFRSMGGDYIDEVDKIVNTVYRYVRAIVSSADPEMDRKEYLSKLYKLVQKANEDLNAPDAVEPVNMIITKYLAGQVNKDTIVKYKEYFQKAALSRKDPAAGKPTHPDGELQRWKVSRYGIQIMVKARNANDAIAKAKSQNSTIANASDDEFTVTSLGPVIQPTAQPTTQPTGSQQQSFTGWWKIVDGNGQELHRFNGIGNSQADANRIARQWLEQNRTLQARSQQGEQFDVLPVMA